MPLVLSMRSALPGLVVLGMAIPACLPERLDRCGRGAAGEVVECVVPGWIDRSFELRIPASWDGVAPLPVVALLHGGGGNREVSDRTTCAGGDTSSPACFAALATARGWAVVIPDGTGGRPLRGVRTWNAGGGGAGAAGELDCVSGQACAADVDDLGYIDDLFDEVAAAIAIDPQRTFATGLSNGAGMSHRLACEDGGRFAAVVAVAGGNQHALAGGPCAGGVAVLQIHGTDDRCWPYAGGGGECIAELYKAGADETMEGWARRNGCGDAFVDEPLPDTDPTDGVTSLRRRWLACARATELVRSEGAGHTWPGGHPYAEVAGRVTHDFGSALILEFFDANPRP